MEELARYLGINIEDLWVWLFKFHFSLEELVSVS